MAEEKDDNQKSYDLRFLAGHRLIQGKPIFSEDGKNLFVPSGTGVRIYSTETGSFQKEVICQSKDFIGSDDEVFFAQLHPAAPSDLLVFFTRKGKIVITDLNTNNDVLTKDLFRDGRIDPKTNEMRFATVISKMSKSRKTNRVLYILYGIKKETRIYSLAMKDVIQDNPCLKKVRGMNLARFDVVKTKKEYDKSKIVFSPVGNFLTVIHSNRLIAYPIPGIDERPAREHKLKSIQGKNKQRINFRFTCVACHPREETVATGVDDGQIILWINFVNHEKPIRKILHWHPNPVSDLCFSAAGTSLYSVGLEYTLVCWDIVHGGRSFRPNLGVPIKMVTCDPGNKLIVLQFEDNTLKVMNTELNDSSDRECNLNEMSYDIFSETVNNVFYEPNSQSLVMNGQPGKLQFYSIKSGDRKSLDVIPRTYFFRKQRDCPDYIQMTITCFAVSPDGSWIATDEVRDDGGKTFIEERLKFWSRVSSKQSYEQNTVIHLPHEKTVTGLKFSPDAKTLISLSTDHTFKIWRLLTPVSAKKYWTLRSTCLRNDSWIPSTVSFSFDSSLAAVVFDSSFVTFWSVMTGDLIPKDTCNSNESWRDPVVGVSFASGVNSHYFVEVRSKQIRVWNFLTKALSWSYIPSSEEKSVESEDSQSTFMKMVYNDSSNEFVCFTDNSVMVFSLLTPSPVAVIQDPRLRSQSLTSCLFIPTSSLTELHSQRDNSLIFFNDKRQLFGLIPDAQESISAKGIESSEAMKVIDEEPTKGSVVIMGQRVFVDSPDALTKVGKKDMKEAKKVIEADFDASRVADTLFVQPASHIFPSMNQLAKTFMTSLFLKKDPPSLQRSSKKSPTKRRFEYQRRNSIDSDSDVE